MTPEDVLQKIQYLNKYSRFLYEKGKRETWGQTVARTVDYLKKESGAALDDNTASDIFSAIFNKEISPSMRLMATAGKAADANQLGVYNCSFLPLSSIKDFYDLTILLGHGVGVGFSVEKRYVGEWEKVPVLTKTVYNFEVEDSIQGWAFSFYSQIANALDGYRVNFNYDKIRPAGSPLMTRGGTASGPEPLHQAHEAIAGILEKRQGQVLRSVDLFDIACHIAGAIVSGGVRRCLPSGSMVHARRGMVPIEEIEVGEEVLTASGYHKVSNVFEQGSQKLVRVVTQDSSFACTPNHRVAVFDGDDSYIWKAASELKFGDKLIAPSFSIDGSKQTLPVFTYEKPKKSTTCKDIIIPELDTEMAWLLGLLHGDGFVGKKEVTIPIHEDYFEMGLRAGEQLKRFGVNVGVTEYDNYFVLRAKSKQLATYFRSWLKQANTLISVPNFIWNATQDVKLAYVAGLMDADGSAKTRPIQVVCTIYEDFAEEIRLLLSSCGIQTRIKALSETNLEDGWRKKYAVVLINSKAKEMFSDIPELFKSELKINKNSEHYTNILPSGLVWSKSDSPLIPVNFVRLEDVEGEEETWDLEVEDVHEFFCEGYLVHNSAMIAIFDKSDTDMTTSKSGEWYLDNLQRQYANISFVVDRRMTLEEWRGYVTMMDLNKSGEPGIWSRYAIKRHLPERRQYVETMGPNPCVEQILRPYELCNLSQIIARPDDTIETLTEKIKLATIVGTIQSSMIDFKNVNDKFKENCEDERLLGVSISGIMDCQLLASGDKKILAELKNVAIQTNKEWADKLGINASVSVTCVKPDGNTSVLYNSAPGVHGRFAPFYIRRMRVQYGTPVANFAIAQGIPAEPAFGETWENCKTVVLSFPVKSPDGAVIQKERGAIEQLDSWLNFKKFYTETNPSVTINYRQSELEDIALWLFKHQDYAIGLSFLPIDDHTYQQAPYEEITEEQYNSLSKIFDDVDMDKFWEYEDSKHDTTETVANLACVGGACLI